jgi:NAD(P)-dependent dehydrogenase (short-subunit alcohol dehydrogenase family)
MLFLRGHLRGLSHSPGRSLRRKAGSGNTKGREPWPKSSSSAARSRAGSRSSPGRPAAWAGPPPTSSPPKGSRSRSPTSAARPWRRIATAFGGLDFVINNAGVARLSPLEDEGYEESWAWQFDILLGAHQRIIRAALPFLRRSSCPRIVNIASTEALGATPNNSIYTAAKHGVAGLTRALAVDLGREGITVNCICPGPILTGMTEKIPEEHRTIFAKRRTALRRYGDPAEVAHMMLSLCLPAASFVTGAVIPVDGGLTIRNA